jgi:hypothetical protein
VQSTESKREEEIPTLNFGIEVKIIQERRK